MTPLTETAMYEALDAPDVTRVTPDGEYRLDGARAVAAYLADPARFHETTQDNPTGDPVVALVAADGPWWVINEARPRRRR